MRSPGTPLNRYDIKTASCSVGQVASRALPGHITDPIDQVGIGDEPPSDFGDVRKNQ